MAFWNKEQKQKVTFLLSSTTSVPLAHAELIRVLDKNHIGQEGDFTQVRITDEKLFPLPEVVQVVPLSQKEKSWMGHIASQVGRVVMLEPLQATGGELLRQNLRMPVNFLSSAIKRNGTKVPIRACDLSSGGIAFYSAGAFQEKTYVDVIIPIVEPEPLTVTCKILRKKPFQDPIEFYACQFYNLNNDAERQLRETVFRLQSYRKR